jgi:hypothetical protein
VEKFWFDGTVTTGLVVSGSAGTENEVLDSVKHGSHGTDDESLQKVFQTISYVPDTQSTGISMSRVPPL